MSTSVATMLVARQPVFNLHGAIWGYELLFRDPTLQPGFGGKSDNAATSTVMIDGFELIRPLLRAKQRCLINFTEDFIVAELPSILPPAVCAIEILESVNPTHAVLQALKSMKRQGYILALDDFIGQEHLRPFLPLVDIIKVDVLRLDPGKLAPLVSFLGKYPAELLAEKVEDSKTAALCRTCGFTLFQGFFYNKSEMVWGKKLNPSQVIRIRLLSLTANPKSSIRQVAETITADVYLTFKLFKFINSLYFGLPVKVQSVDHAIALMGLQKVRQWLCVTVLADLDATPMSREVAYISAIRAKFLEILGKKCTVAMAQDPNFSSKLFISGLFSMLEPLLRIPIKEIFASTPLDSDVLQVLCEGNGPLASWHQLMIGYERGHWDEVAMLSRTLGLQAVDLVTAYCDAGLWSTALFEAH